MKIPESESESENFEQVPKDLTVNSIDSTPLSPPTQTLGNINAGSSSIPLSTSGSKTKFEGEDVFSEESVKDWQTPRIKAWEARRSSPEGFYFRFVAPGEGQHNGKWSREEHKRFMARYEEWSANGFKMGQSWGLFSIAIPHRVGYQCMNYYRKLVKDGVLKDDAYATQNGVLKQITKDRTNSTASATELGAEWNTEEVKEIERNVDSWIKDIHSRNGT
ncbi:hypothetical protein CLU79DRAFT_704668 [Phycomyces nitens]|nr:hypothetical protein CLU79DRAFT_704668 [Phycomyces nitens]